MPPPHRRRCVLSSLTKKSTVLIGNNSGNNWTRDPNMTFSSLIFISGNESASTPPKNCNYYQRSSCLYIMHTCKDISPFLCAYNNTMIFPLIVGWLYYCIIIYCNIICYNIAILPTDSWLKLQLLRPPRQLWGEAGRWLGEQGGRQPRADSGWWPSVLHGQNGRLRNHNVSVVGTSRDPWDIFVLLYVILCRLV